jgi:hypothetical protein
MHASTRISPLQSKWEMLSRRVLFKVLSFQAPSGRQEFDRLSRQLSCRLTHTEQQGGTLIRAQEASERCSGAMIRDEAEYENSCVRRRGPDPAWLSIVHVSKLQKHHHSSLSLSATEHAAEMHALLGSFIVGTMNGRNRHRVWAWLLCALLFWLTVNPPHCDLCDGISFTVASAHQSIVKRSHPVAPDDCNGICSCCWFHGLPNGRQVLIPVNIELAGVAPEAPRPAFVLRSTIFRPPRTVVS